MIGVIEGFYGTPWTWETRREVAGVLSGGGMDTYVYAPKDDPLHRSEWRTPYSRQQLGEFTRFTEDNTLRLGVALSPGLSMDYTSSTDRAALRDKFLALIDAGASVVGLCLDDIDPTPGCGVEHGDLTAWLQSVLPDHIDLFFVPLHYTGIEPAQYLTEIDQRVPDSVPIAWTGNYVVNSTITVEDAQSWSSVMSGRQPLLWDNTPVNDAIMEHQLFTGPLSGRDVALPEHLSGYLGNAMLQAAPSIAPLLSAGAWWAGEDAISAWRAAVDDHPQRQAFMEAFWNDHVDHLCDQAIGTVDSPQVSVEGCQALKLWLDQVVDAGTGGFGEEVEPWSTALHQEAQLAQFAVDLLLSDEERFHHDLIVMVAMWAHTPRTKSALGRSTHLDLNIYHDENSQWRMSPSAYVESKTLTERLVAEVFRRAQKRDR